jgi:hypothetical protein
MRQGRAKVLADGSKQLVVGTVATHAACEGGGGALAVCGRKTARLWAPDEAAEDGE